MKKNAFLKRMVCSTMVFLLSLGTLTIGVQAASNDASLMPESGVVNLDPYLRFRRPGSTFQWVGNKTSGGDWEYGVDWESGNAVTVFSNLKTKGYENHTSVKPGRFASVVNSGWKPVGTQAISWADGSYAGGNKAYYDIQ